MTDVVIKRGDTLIADCTYKDANGSPVNLDTAGITIESCVRSADGAALHRLEFIKQDQATRPGEYRLRGDSSTWERGDELAWDIRYWRGGDTFSSRTIKLRVIEGITPA